jgi:peroxiredoxin-like protein
MESKEYQVDLEWKENKIGEISSPILNDKIAVATPPEFPAGIEGVWSPEHLFTAAVNSCFMTTFLAIAEKSRLNFKAFTCQAKGKLELVEKTFKMTEVNLYPVLTLENIEDQEKANKVLVKSENACLISNSIMSKVILNITIKH